MAIKLTISGKVIGCYCDTVNGEDTAKQMVLYYSHQHKDKDGEFTNNEQIVIPLSEEQFRVLCGKNFDDKHVEISVKIG